tara:strand:- start:2426 stop:3058 length:633 start_codon:yes stop_codon:yes gene_type:complete
MIEYSLSDKKIYNDKLTADFNKYFINYKKIILMYLNHYKNIIENKEELNNEIKFNGVSALTNIYLILLISTKNLNATMHNCEKTIFYYFEFIEQMNAPKTDIQAILKLNVFDAKLFIYKKTIYDIIEINYKNNDCEEEFFSNIKNFTLVINRILEILINSNKKIDTIINSLGDIIDEIPYNINNNQVDIIRNIKTYTTNSELLSILNEGT